MTIEKAFEIFMEDDKKGLKALYKVTNDELCNIALDWLTTYDESNTLESNEFNMYNDVISYLWKKYNL